MKLRRIMRQWRKSRTMVFAALYTAFGAAQATIPALQGAISPLQFGIITVAAGVIVALLRLQTTQPLNDK